MKKARGDGVELQVAVWPGHGGKDVLCIHGLTANCRGFDLLAAAMTPPHTTLAFDLRGRGNSEKPQEGYSVDRHCRDILCLMNNLGIKRPVLLGHSLGALIALAFAAENPSAVDRMILIDGGGVLSEAQREKVLAGIRPSLERLGKRFPTVEDYLTALKNTPFFQPWNSYLEQYFRYEIEVTNQGVGAGIEAAHILEEIKNMQAVAPTALYPRILCPVLILRATRGMLADDDILLPEEAVQSMLQDMARAECVDIHGADHYSILFRSHPLRDQAIRSFLDL